MELATDAIDAELAQIAVDLQANVIAAVRWKSSRKKSTLDHHGHGIDSESASRENTRHTGVQFTQHFALPLALFP